MAAESRKIAYFLESTCLCGGVKVVFRQAEALMKRGCDVTIVCHEDYPDWFEGMVTYRRVNPLNALDAAFYDIVIGTTPRLVLQLYPKVHQRLVHLIQGYEPDIVEFKPYLDIVRKAYALPVIRITVSETMRHIFSQRYPEQQFISAGQGLESDYFYPHPDATTAEQPVDRVFLIGPLGISFKQLHVGLTACRLIQRQFPDIKLIRISPVDTQAEEEAMVGPIEEYHVHVSPKNVGHILRTGNGIFISSSDAGEGFGLPAIEAMACGVPVVLTDILSYRTFAIPCDYAEFARCGDAVSLSDAIRVLIDDPVKRYRRIRRGLEVAAQFSYDRVARDLEGVFDSVRSRNNSLSI